MISNCRRGDLSSHHSLKSSVGTLLSNKSPSKVIMMGTPKKSDVPTSKAPQQQQQAPVKEEETPSKTADAVPPTIIKKRDLKRKCK